MEKMIKLVLEVDVYGLWDGLVFEVIEVFYLMVIFMGFCCIVFSVVFKVWLLVVDLLEIVKLDYGIKFE